MRRQDKLAIAFAIHQHGHQRELAGGRERRLRLVQQIEAARLNARGEQREKTFAVRARVRIHAIARVQLCQRRGEGHFCLAFGERAAIPVFFLHASELRAQIPLHLGNSAREAEKIFRAQEKSVPGFAGKCKL